MKKNDTIFRIGYSTHEEPSIFVDGAIIKSLFDKGATVFEKHVGLSIRKI